MSTYFTTPYLMTHRYNDLIRMFSDLLDQPEPAWQENRFFETEYVSFTLANGEYVICKPATSVLEQTYLGPVGEGLFAMILQSGDLKQTNNFYAESQFEVAKDDFGISWLRPDSDLNMFIGYRP